MVLHEGEDDALFLWFFLPGSLKYEPAGSVTAAASPWPGEVIEPLTTVVEYQLSWTCQPESEPGANFG